MSDLDVQIRSYFESIAPAFEVEDLVRGTSRAHQVETPGVSRPRWGPVVVAVVAAVVVLVLVGGVSLFVARGGGDVVDEQTPTSVPLPSSDVDAGGFTPSISGIGIDDAEWGWFVLDSRAVDMGDATFEVWELAWGVDWPSVVAAVVDEPTRLRIENEPFDSSNQVGWTWVPDRAILDFYWGLSRQSFAQLRLGFAGTSDGWTIAVSDAETGFSIGALEGSLPGIEPDEILRRVTGHGLVGWFFVASDGERLQVDPPWRSFFESGGDAEFVAVGDQVLAFVVTGDIGPGQMTIWSSRNGIEWENLGEAPWPGRRYVLDTLAERDGEVLALIVGDEVGDEEGAWHPSPENPGTPRYWSSVDGATWVELTEDQWNQKSGGIRPTPNDSGVNPDTPQAIVDYFDAVTSTGTVIPDELAVIQPTPGPEPQFDTSSLGRQIPLHVATPGDTVVDRLRLAVDLSDAASGVVEPIIHIGRVVEPFETEFLVWMTPTGGLCEGYLEPTDGSRAPGFTCSMPAELNPADPIRQPLDGLIVTYVPVDASAVAMTLDGGEPMWQRPVSGWALFPGHLDATTQYTLQVYDSHGDIISTHER